MLARSPRGARKAAPSSATAPAQIHPAAWLDSASTARKSRAALLPVHETSSLESPYKHIRGLPRFRADSTDFSPHHAATKH